MPDEQPTYYVLTEEQLRALAYDAAAEAVEGVSSELGTQYETLAGLVVDTSEAVAHIGAAAGEAVSLTDAQYDELTQLLSAQVHGSLYVFGALMFLVGIYGITQVVRHWRGE